METQIESVTLLISMDEAIQDHLEVIAKRNYEWELKRLAEERRELEQKKEFAHLLAKHIGEKYGVCVSPSWVYDGLKKDHIASAAPHFRFSIEFETEVIDGKNVVGTLMMLHSRCVDDIQKSPRYIEWKALRSYFRPNEERHYDDFYECKTEDFVEALTFAKTGKQ